MNEAQVLQLQINDRVRFKKNGVVDKLFEGVVQSINHWEKRVGVTIDNSYIEMPYRLIKSKINEFSLEECLNDYANLLLLLNSKEHAQDVLMKFAKAYSGDLIQKDYSRRFIVVVVEGNKIHNAGGKSFKSESEATEMIKDIKSQYKNDSLFVVCDIYL